MFRRSGALAVLLLLAAAPLAAPASAGTAEVSVTTLTAAPMHPGQTAWVSVLWTTEKNVHDFAVMARPPSGVTVSYPADRAFTSLYGSSTLAKRTVDFTAIKVSVPFSARGSITLPLDATWKGGGRSKSTTASVVIPLVVYSGPDRSLETTTLTVPGDTPTWVEVRYRGQAPRLDDFRVTATAPAGIGIVHPGDASSSGLNGDSALLGGTVDFAGFRIDASGVAPGTYTLQLTETFTRPDAATTTGSVTLVVQ